MKTLLALSALLLLAVPSRAQVWETVSGRDSGVNEARTATARTPKESAELWKLHDAGAGRALPQVDFSKEFVTASWTGAGEYSMRKRTVLSAAATADSSAVSLAKSGEKAAAAATEPAAMKELKKGTWAIVFRGGPTFTDYAHADITINTPRVQGVA